MCDHNGARKWKRHHEKEEPIQEEPMAMNEVEKWQGEESVVPICVEENGKIKIEHIGRGEG